jgi:hypothetical protein
MISIAWMQFIMWRGGGGVITAHSREEVIINMVLMDFCLPLMIRVSRWGPSYSLRSVLMLAGLHTPGSRAWICKRLSSPGIDYEESLPPGYTGWWHLFLGIDSWVTEKFTNSRSADKRRKVKGIWDYSKAYILFSLAKSMLTIPCDTAASLNCYF